MPRNWRRLASSARNLTARPRNARLACRVAGPSGHRAQNSSAAARSVLLERADDLAALARRSYSAVVYLGSGGRVGAAHEAALKMLESTSGSAVTMSESFLGLRHGPMAALSKDSLVVAFLSSDPVVRAYETGAKSAEPWATAATVASGLRGPAPFADTLSLDAIRRSGGTAVAVSEESMLDAMLELASLEGCFACPEGGATLAALRQLVTSGEIAHDARVVIYDTGSGLKYPEAWRAALARRAQKAVHA